MAREANGFPRLSKLSESAEPNLHCGFRLHSLDCDGLEFDLIRLHCGFRLHSLDCAGLEFASIRLHCGFRLHSLDWNSGARCGDTCTSHCPMIQHSHDLHDIMLEFICIHLHSLDWNSLFPVGM